MLHQIYAAIVPFQTTIAVCAFGAIYVLAYRQMARTCSNPEASIVYVAPRFAAILLATGTALWACTAACSS
jgi:hypothetical protein